MIKTKYNIELENRKYLEEEQLKNIDIIYNIPHYGLVDISGNLVMLREERLKVCSLLFEDTENFLALDFVADSFLELKQKYELSFTNNKLSLYFQQNLKLKKPISLQ
jgi:hypothetical protein